MVNLRAAPAIAHHFRMSVLRFIAGIAVAAFGVLGLLRLGYRRGQPPDLGRVSDQWRAEQRGHPQDPVF